MIVAHHAVGDGQRAAVVVDAAAIATTKLDVSMRSEVAVDDAVRQRHCGGAAILGVVVDAAPSEIGAIATDGAVEDRQCRAAAGTIVVNTAAAVVLKGEAVLQGTALYRQCSMIIQNSTAALLSAGTTTHGETSDCDSGVGHDMKDTEVHI